MPFRPLAVVVNRSAINFINAHSLHQKSLHGYIWRMKNNNDNTQHLLGAQYGCFLSTPLSVYKVPTRSYNEHANYKSVLFSINHTSTVNNENEIKHTRNKMVCTSFDRLTTEPL